VASIEPPAVRPAAPRDAAAIAGIYNEGIADRMATFETRERVAADISERFADDLPFVVAVGSDDAVVGWVRVAPYSDRCVYEGVGEHSVYVARAARGQGVGRLLLDSLCTAATDRGLTSSTRSCSPTIWPAAPHTGPRASRKLGSSAATVASMGSGATACSLSVCSARPRTEQRGSELGRDVGA